MDWRIRYLPAATSVLFGGHHPSLTGDAEVVVNKTLGRFLCNLELAVFINFEEEESGGGSEALVASLTLTPEQILADPAEAIALVAAPGAGKIIVPMFPAIAKYNYDAVAYSCDVTLALGTIDQPSGWAVSGLLGADSANSRTTAIDSLVDFATDQDPESLEDQALMVTVQPQASYQLYGDEAPGADGDDGASYELGFLFSTSQNGYVIGLRFYKVPANVGPHSGTIWNGGGDALGTLTFVENFSGWQTSYFAAPIPISSGTVYTASYFASHGHYVVDSHFFDSAQIRGPLTGIDAETVSGNGVYRSTETSAIPATPAANNVSYGLDVIFAPTVPPLPDTGDGTIVVNVPYRIADIS